MNDGTGHDASAEYRESSFREKMLEHVFVAEVLQEVWFRWGQTLEVLHSEVDSAGYDLVLAFNGIIRHVQLKSSKQDATTANLRINIALAEKPSGCVVWMFYSELLGVHRARLCYRFFGGDPGEPLPSLGERVAKHSKGNAQGVKLPRPDIRLIGKGVFTPPMDLPTLMGRLFGPIPFGPSEDR